MSVPRVIIGSIETYSGKSAIGLGIAMHYKDKGLGVGFMKPIGNVPITLDSRQTDEDAYLISQELGSSKPLEAVSPIILTAAAVEQALSGDDKDYPGIVRRAFDQVSEDRELVVIEGAADLSQGKALGVSLVEVASILDAPVILVIRSSNPMIVDNILTAAQSLGEHLLGVVFVSLPRPAREEFQSRVKPYLEKHGVKVLGLLPLERSLMSVTVGEITEALGGEILCNPEHSEDLVETYLVGAMGQERALSFFRRKGEKAVITGGDRSDVQLAALETSTRCLILTGNLAPSPAVIARAEEKEVPVILAPQDTFTAVQMVENITGRIGFHQPRKVKQMRIILEEHFDFATLDKTLNLRAD